MNFVSGIVLVLVLIERKVKIFSGFVSIVFSLGEYIGSIVEGGGSYGDSESIGRCGDTCMKNGVEIIDGVTIQDLYLYMAMMLSWLVPELVTVYAEVLILVSSVFGSFVYVVVLVESGVVGIDDSSVGVISNMDVGKRVRGGVGYSLGCGAVLVDGVSL